MSEIPRYISLALSIGLFVSLWRNFIRSWIGTRASKLDIKIFNQFAQPIFARVAPDNAAELELKYNRWKVWDDFVETAGMVFIVGIDAELEITKNIPIEYQVVFSIILFIIFMFRLFKMREEDFDFE